MNLLGANTIQKYKREINSMTDVFSGFLRKAFWSLLYVMQLHKNREESFTIISAFEAPLVSNLMKIAITNHIQACEPFRFDHSVRGQMLISI